MGKKVIYFFLVGFILLVAVGVYLINPFETKVKSGLQVITEGGSAALFLNDQYLDKTPYINKKIRPGQYTLRIEPDDAQLNSYETQVNLNRGLLTVVTWKLGTTPDTSGGVIYEMESLDNRKQTEVSFVTVPDNAIISFDQQEKQFSPLVIKDVEAGHHEFQVNLPSFEPQRHTINVVAGHRLNIFVKLSKSETDPDLKVGLEDESNQLQSDADQAETELETATSQTATDSAQIFPQVRIKNTNYFQQQTQVLRVRSEPNLNSQEVGFVEAGQTYRYLEQTENNWHYIEFIDPLDQEQKQGWASGEFAEIVEQ